MYLPHFEYDAKDVSDGYLRGFCDNMMQ